MILVNGKQSDTLVISDRGLQYGDGVFETIAIKQNTPQFLDSHLDRLILGCKTLLIKSPDLGLLKSEIASLTSTLTDRAVLKVIITRGTAGRGYRPDATSAPTRILSLNPWGEHIDAFRQNGIDIMLCETRLAHNPQLAGLKHLNRLEQVLASAELTDVYQEGIMQDADGSIIEGTMSNLFIVTGDNCVKTPLLDQCGIQGIMKKKLLGWLQDNHFTVIETNISLNDMLTAKSVFMSNSIIGLWPVKSFKYKQETQQYTIPDFVAVFNKTLDFKHKSH